MTGSDFVEQCWKCKTIRRYICDQAKRRGYTDEDREDLAQEAWLVIGTLPGCQGISACKELTEKAIYSGYWQQNKERLMLTTIRKPPTMKIPGGRKPYSEDGCYQTQECLTDHDHRFLAEIVGRNR